MVKYQNNRRIALYKRWYGGQDLPRFSTLPPFLQKMLLLPYRGRRERFVIYLTFRANGFSEADSKTVALYFITKQGSGVIYRNEKHVHKHIADIEKQLQGTNAFHKYAIYDFHLGRFCRG
jgi:hypothetical protein